MKTMTHSARYISRLSALLKRVDFRRIESVIGMLDKARKKGRTIFFMGNGGSAATASHFANDLSSIKMPQKQGLFNARSLADNVACLTALANDEGYENVFVDQLRASLRRGDVLIAISASGNSPNLLKAIRYAKRNGGRTIGLVGFDGGKMKKLCHEFIHFNTGMGEYGPVEDMHLMLDHLITSYFMAKYGAKQRRAKKKHI